MMQIEAVIALFPDLAQTELAAWVEQHWIEPEPDEQGAWVFQEIDIARVRLIYDLRRDLEVAEETVPLILSLLDQIYELRAQLKAVSRAVHSLPEPMQQRVMAALEAPIPLA
jgi:chaperone modulatory protein CbpM